MILDVVKKVGLILFYLVSFLLILVERGPPAVGHRGVVWRERVSRSALTLSAS